MNNNDTKLNKIKTICLEKGYFQNKKTIDWNNISKIGIISKLEKINLWLEADQ